MIEPSDSYFLSFTANAVKGLHPLVVRWIDLIIDRNWHLMEDKAIELAKKGFYVPVRGKTRKKSESDYPLAKKIRAALGNYPDAWQSIKYTHKYVFSVKVPHDLADAYRNLAREDKKQLCGLTLTDEVDGPTITLARPILAFPIRRNRAGTQFVHQYRFSPLLADLLPTLVGCAESTVRHYPNIAFGVYRHGGDSMRCIKPGKKFKSSYCEGCRAEFLIHCVASF